VQRQIKNNPSIPNIKAEESSWCRKHRTKMHIVVDAQERPDTGPTLNPSRLISFET
jgi:hypothetical protein